MPKVPKEEIRKEGGAEVAPTRSVKRLFSLAHERATRAIVSVSLAAALASCSPATLNAQETTPAKGKAEAAAVEKKPVTYETIADLSELQPYLDAAKDKTFTLGIGEVKQLGPYSVRIFASQDNTTTYKIRPEGSDREYDIIKINNYKNVNVVLIDMGENHPYIKGKMLAFTDNKEVEFMYFSKGGSKYQKATISLEEGNMRSGPVQPGYGVNASGSLFVFCAPKDIRPGDVVIQGDIATDGSTGASFYIYAPDKPSGTLVASIAMR